MQDKFAAYLRVSTNQQGADGNGMAAQRHAVRNFLGGKKPDWEFVEVETGKRKDNPELQRALACCKKYKVKLLISRLDRLSRNAAFLLGLMESKVDFVCADMPNADKFTIQILACVAQKEAELISQRTKDALAAAAKRGVRLGNPRLSKVRHLAYAAKTRKAKAFAMKLKPVLVEAQRRGDTTLRKMAKTLNRLGYRTPNGNEFFPQSVKNLLALIYP